jgi:preprotein translocase subunit SecG
MHVLLNILVGVQMIAALSMIGLVLVQHGKGADMGASFGSGSSGSLFGASGSANFLSRMTAICAAVFFACTLGLAYFSNYRGGVESGSTVLDRPSIPASAASASSAPVAPPVGAAQIPGNAPVQTTAPSMSPTPSVTASGAAMAAPAASGVGAIPAK